MTDLEKQTYDIEIPFSVLHNNKLPGSARLFYGELLATKDENGVSHISKERLAELYDLSLDRTTKLLNMLRREGLIKIHTKRDPHTKMAIDREITIL